MKLGSSRQVFEKHSNMVFHEIHPLGAKLFHADRRTDTTKLIVAFRHFAKAPKNCKKKIYQVQSMTVLLKM